MADSPPRSPFPQHSSSSRRSSISSQVSTSSQLKHCTIPLEKMEVTAHEPESAKTKEDSGAIPKGKRTAQKTRTPTVPPIITEQINLLKTKLDCFFEKGGDKGKWKSDMIKRFDDLTQIISQEIHSAKQLSSDDLADLIVKNDQKLQEISDKVDKLQEQTHSLSAANKSSYADIVKSKQPPPTTLIIKPKENGPTLKAIQDGIDNAKWPPNLLIANKKARFNHLEIRPASLKDKALLTDLILTEVPEAQVEDKRSRTVRIIFHNASRFDPEAIKHSLMAMGFDEDDLQDFDNPHQIKSRSDGDYHWVINLHRGKANSILLEHYDPGRSNSFFVGPRRLYFRIYHRLTRCRNCQSLGKHPTSFCRNKPFCDNCGRSQCSSNPCTSDPRCINCEEFNDRIRAYPSGSAAPRNLNHKASERSHLPHVQSRPGVPSPKQTN